MTSIPFPEPCFAEVAGICLTMAKVFAIGGSAFLAFSVTAFFWPRLGPLASLSLAAGYVLVFNALAVGPVELAAVGVAATGAGLLLAASRRLDLDAPDVLGRWSS